MYCKLNLLSQTLYIYVSYKIILNEIYVAIFEGVQKKMEKENANRKFISVTQVLYVSEFNLQNNVIFMRNTQILFYDIKELNCFFPAGILSYSEKCFTINQQIS